MALESLFIGFKSRTAFGIYDGCADDVEHTFEVDFSPENWTSILIGGDENWIYISRFAEIIHRRLKRDLDHVNCKQTNVSKDFRNEGIFCGCDSLGCDC